MNCFSLQAASDPTRFAKHFFLLPPSTSSIVRPPLDSRSSHVQRNTSHLDFYLQNSHAAPVSSSTALDRVYVDGLTDADAEKLSRIAMSCVLKEGDTLFIPRGWWHRVENVDMSWHHGSPEGLCGGWTAGVAWWFLFRWTLVLGWNLHLLRRSSVGRRHPLSIVHSKEKTEGSNGNSQTPDVIKVIFNTYMCCPT